jgi:uncharacterized protein with NRDE domain
MCLLALLYRVLDDAPLVIGANREEYYRRGGEPPRLLGTPPAVAGIDPLAGGTWLGGNAWGVVVAITNRRKTRLPAEPRSRGLLARDLLACSSARQAAWTATRELERDLYAGCNFLCADADQAVVIHAGDWLRVRPLPPGIHVLANADINDPTDARATHAARWLEEQDFRNSADCLRGLRRLCASPEPDGSPICFRDATRGTVSSTLLALPRDLAAGTMWHAQGSPDRVPYVDCSHLLLELAGAVGET